MVLAGGSSFASPKRQRLARDFHMACSPEPAKNLALVIVRSKGVYATVLAQVSLPVSLSFIL